MEITISDLHKYYNNDKPVVKELNLKIKDGEFTTILGPSGCGKSTTLLMVAGINSITYGEIYFDDRKINRVPPKDRNIGMVFQNSALYPNITVLQNIAFPLKNKKVPKKEREERAKKAAKLVHMGEYLHRKPKQLSGGQQQRVAIARALAKKPGLFLLDEPLSSLDAELRLKLREEIRRIQRKLNITTIMVTHDQEEAMAISDKIAVMKDGRIQQYDTPQALITRPQNWFVASFLGMPTMNRLDCAWNEIGKSLLIRVDNDIILLPDAIKKKLTNTYIGQNLILGFRPHDIEVCLKAPRKGEKYVHGKVAVIEYTGREKMLNISLGEDIIKGFVDFNEEVEIGDEVWFKINNLKYLFDSDGEQRNILLG